MKLKAIGGGAVLEHNTAIAYLACLAAGMPPGGITSAYRDDDEQVRLFNDNYTSNKAASAKKDPRTWNGTVYWRRIRKVSNGAPTVSVGVPGTSNHGNGTALDLKAPQQAWMRAHGAAFGFINPAWAKKAGTLEPWHWEFVGGTQAPPAHVPAPLSRKDDDMQIYIASSASSNGVIPAGMAFIWTGDGPLCPLSKRVLGAYDYYDDAAPDSPRAQHGLPLQPYRAVKWTGDDIYEEFKWIGIREWNRAADTIIPQLTGGILRAGEIETPGTGSAHSLDVKALAAALSAHVIAALKSLSWSTK